MDPVNRPTTGRMLNQAWRNNGPLYLVTPDPDDGPYEMQPDHAETEPDAIYAFATYALTRQDEWSASTRKSYCDRLKRLIQTHGDAPRTRGTPRTREWDQVVHRWMRDRQGAEPDEIIRQVAQARQLKADTVRRHLTAAGHAAADTETAPPLPRIVTEAELERCRPYDPILVDKLDAVATSTACPPARSLDEIGRMLFAKNYAATKQQDHG